MNEALRIYKENKTVSNHVITHLDVKNEKPIELFRSSKWIINQIQVKKRSQLVK